MAPGNPARQAGRALFRYRVGMLAGLLLFLAGLGQYRSFENRPVLGIWSYAFFALFIVAVAVLAVAAVWAWRGARRGRASTRRERVSRAAFDLGVLFWGVAYLLSAADSVEQAARATDLNFFGSVVPVAALLEWVSLGAFWIAVVGFVAPRVPKRRAGPALACASVLTLLLIGEGVARLIAVVAPTTHGFPTHSSAIWERYHVALNGAGFRDVEHDIRKPDGTRRLLVVGDSYAFGLGVDLIEDRFGEQLAEFLEDATDTPWEAINASRGNTHTLRHIEYLETTLPFDPDIVVLLYVFNDIEYLRPVTVRLLPRKLTLTGVVYQNSFIFQEAFIRFRRLPAFDAAEAGNDPYADGSLVQRHLEDIRRFVDMAEAAGARTWVVPFDNNVTLDKTILRRCLDFCARAEAAGIPTISLCDAFGGYPRSQLVVNRLDSHPNKLAHRLAARAAEEQIVPQWSAKAAQARRTALGSTSQTRHP